jgi:hypothetical protein
MSEDNVAVEEMAPVEAQQATVTWRDGDMTSNFANVVNIQSTKDQVDLFFGTNQTWNMASSNEVVVDLSNRLILTPLVAKRLYLSLGRLLDEHEKRHGELPE